MTIDDTTNFKSNFAIAPTLPRILTGETLNRNDVVTTSNGPATASTAYREMMARWELPLHLMGGTLAMREAKQKYLPQEPGESNDSYTNRVNRTILYGIYSRTIKALSSIPFIDPVIVKDAPRELEYLKADATDDLQSIADLGLTLLEDLFNYGKAHYLVEYPHVPGAENMNLAEERAMGNKPYFARINPANLIGWTVEGGRLTSIRMYDYEVVQTVDYAEEYRHVVREITPTEYRVWRANIESKSGDKNASQWIMDPPIPNTLGYIGLVTIYGNKEGAPFVSSPVLEELAWLNLKHFQKLSDLDNVEHVANVPFLFGKGFSEDELQQIEVSVHGVIGTTNENAELGYVEHSGQAIPYAQASIEAIEKRCMVMGADFLSQVATSRQTAYAKSVDTGKTLSVLQAIVNNLSEGLAKGYHIAGDWLGIDASATEVTVGEGIDLSLDSNDVAYLRQMVLDGFLSTEQFQYELQRRGKISDSTILKEPAIKDSVTEEDQNNQQTEGDDNDAD